MRMRRGTRRGSPHGRDSLRRRERSHPGGQPTGRQFLRREPPPELCTSRSTPTWLPTLLSICTRITTGGYQILYQRLTKRTIAFSPLSSGLLPLLSLCVLMRNLGLVHRPENWIPESGPLYLRLATPEKACRLFRSRRLKADASLTPASGAECRHSKAPGPCQKTHPYAGASRYVLPYAIPRLRMRSNCRVDCCGSWAAAADSCGRTRPRPRRFFRDSMLSIHYHMNPIELA
ncbi:hypothetical protein OH77DRAFT_1016512 [Trametes cingulata]|nr:hypothetical protein OH77DRAFT_1016512 [Trametes cingulata]